MKLRPIESKKGQGVLGGLTDNVVGFGVFVLVLAIIGVVVAEFQQTQRTEGVAEINETSIGFNITGDGLDGISTISGFSNVIAIVIVAGVVLALVGGFFLLNRR